jgi:hypothetical protein
MYMHDKELRIFVWGWWCITVIPAIERLRQEYLEFEASLGNTSGPSH